MARERSAAPARTTGGTLVVAVLTPIAIVAVLVAVAAALIANGGGRSAADKELDARARTVERAWASLDRPSGRSALAQLSRRLDAGLVVVRGRKPAAGKTPGDTRTYAFAAPNARTLRVSLATKDSSKSLSSGLTAAFAAALAGLLLLLAVGTGLLRLAVAGPLRGFAAAVARFKSGDQMSRAEIGGAREVRVAAGALNEVIERVAALQQAAGTDPVTGLPSTAR